LVVAVAYLEFECVMLAGAELGFEYERAEVKKIEGMHFFG
jgi:hypothetical protein